MGKVLQGKQEGKDLAMEQTPTGLDDFYNIGIKRGSGMMKGSEFERGLVQRRKPYIATTLSKSVPFWLGRLPKSNWSLIPLETWQTRNE